MNTKNFYPKNISILKKVLIISGLLAPFCAAVLSVNSCNLPGGPDTAGGFGTGTLTLYLPESSVQGAAAQNKAAGVSRSVLSDSFTGTLQYRLAFTGPGETQTLEAGGGGTTVSLDAGQWTIEAAAYDPGNPSVTVGSGSAVITVIAGQNSSVRIPMKVDPAYEGTLREIYIHNEAELRRIGAASNGLAINDSARTFYLENDIVLTQPWIPIGSPGNPFKAKFDGNNKKITVSAFGSPVIDTNDNTYLGFFAYIDGDSGAAEIKNIKIDYVLGAAPVTLDNATYFDAYTGGIAGYAKNAAFENIEVNIITGNFSFASDPGSSCLLTVGGIAAEAENVTFTDCHVSGNIAGRSPYIVTAGGVVGDLKGSGSTIRGSFFKGNLNAFDGSPYIGGIAGFVVDSEITACFTEGRIRAETPDDYHTLYVGGIVGNISGSGASVTQCYASGRIEGDIIGSIVLDSTHSNIGGIAGEAYSASIEDCYAWVYVSTKAHETERGGGIAGLAGDISRCYALGTVKSASVSGSPKTTYSGIYLGGIAGADRAFSGTVSGCMALVSELDAGTSGALYKEANAIIVDPTYMIGNYALEVSSTQVTGKMWVQNSSSSPDPGANNKDGEARLLADFKDQTTSNIYTSAGWVFPNVWKWISGYDYPVLHWQTSAPTDPALL
jgi:hypothetical protein